MKKILSLIAISVVLTQSVVIAAEYISPKTKQAIAEYKKGNYTGCQQLLKGEVAQKNSKDIYANYYYGLAIWKSGKPEIAAQYFHKVVTLNPRGDLKYYAQNAMECTQDYENCKAGNVEFSYPNLTPVPVKKVVTRKVTADDIRNSVPRNELDAFIGDNHSQYYKSVKNEVEQKRLEVLKYEINTSRPVDEYEFQKYKNYSNHKTQADKPVLTEENLTAENINTLLETKNLEIQKSYDNLPYIMAQQNKNNIKNR